MNIHVLLLVLSAAFLHAGWNFYLRKQSAYALILYAFTLGAVSYVVAAREVSVVLGTFLGVRFLGEKFTFAKGLGVLVITSGLVLLKLA